MSFPGAQGLQDLSSLKEILQTYNKITEECFQRCTANFGYRELTDLEKACTDSCCAKHMNGNQRMMTGFMMIQSAKQKKMVEDMEKQQQEQQQNQLASGQSGVQTEESFTGAEPIESQNNVSAISENTTAGNTSKSDTLR